LRLPESRRGKLIAGAGVIVAGVALYLLYRRFFPEFDLQQLLDDFANLLGDWTYVIVGLLAFLETGAFVGLLVPGETAMIVGGAVAGLGVINLYLLIAIAWMMAFLGDSFSFMLGRKLGRGFVLRHGSKVGVTRERFEGVEEYFDRHGGKTVLIGRFVGIVRALAPFVAGTSGMGYRGFAPYSILGSGLQVTSNIILGYIFARSIDSAAEYAGTAALILGTVIAVSVAAVVAFRFFRVPEPGRDRHVDGGPPSDQTAGRARASPAAAAQVRGRPPHARRHLRPRVHDAGRDPRGLVFRIHRFRPDIRQRPRTHRRGPQGLRHR
jgi:undecaprenyl-diphosphatase